VFYTQSTMKQATKRGVLVAQFTTIINGSRLALLPSIDVGNMGLAFMFHPSVLEPHFDLTFCKVEQRGYFHAARSAKVFAVVELLLQLQKLCVCVCCSQAARTSLSTRQAALGQLGGAWKKLSKKEHTNCFVT